MYYEFIFFLLKNIKLYKMIVIIPLGGIGSRFQKEGYTLPKALIKVNNKEIICHLLDNLNIETIDYIYIPYNKCYIEYNFESLLKKKYPTYKFKFMVLENQTRGAAETIFNALSILYSNSIRYPINMIEMKQMFDKPILCLDSDAYYKTNIIQKWNGKNCVFTFESRTNDAKYSYVDISNNILTNIVEKDKISDHACTGAYGFDSYYDLMDACKYIIDHNITQKGEFYTSGVIKHLLNTKTFHNINIANKEFVCLGTPNQVKAYQNTYLLDLDGTLVNTDNIYTEVWKTLLKPYNIDCNEEFFHSFIKGKSDVGFLRFLIQQITDEELEKISKSKDELFLEKLKHKTILYEGVYDFFEKIRNSKHIAIVTSCNRKAADYICKTYDLYDYVSLLIASEDVGKHKPHPDPYLKAMDILNVKSENCIIIEDSSSGYLSAKKCKCQKVYIYDNKTNTSVVENANHIISNYCDFNPLQHNSQTHIDDFCSVIMKEMNYLPVKTVQISKDNNLKTGYICDIDRFIVTYFDNKEENIIVKISNLNNELSKTAKKLNMYENELYFYKHISHILSQINIPKSYASFIHENREVLIMEDLNKYNGCFDVNLNKNVNVLMKVVECVFNMHNVYYFEKKEDVINCMKSLHKPIDVTYYGELVKDRYHKFISKNTYIISESQKVVLNNIFENYTSLCEQLSKFPLSFCHGDLKSPNIFYKNNNIPYLLDWQYTQLNKGVSDIVFLMVESINFDPMLCNLILHYYYKLLSESRNISYDVYMEDVTASLCVFPFFVMVWFNSEDNEKLIDKCFPLRFMKNLLKYYDYYLK